MKRTFAFALGATLLFAGCGSNGSDQDTPSPSVDSPLGQPEPTSQATPATSEIPTSPRGYRLKTFGDRSGSGCFVDDEPCDVEFVVKAPLPATNCDSAYAPEIGQLLAFPVRVETKLGGDMTPFGGMWNPNSFSALLPNGVTVPRITSAATYGCSESDMSIPDTLAPASVYEGFVVLDVPVDATDLIYAPQLGGGGQGGWEWPL